MEIDKPILETQAPPELPCPDGCPCASPLLELRELLVLIGALGKEVWENAAPKHD